MRPFLMIAYLGLACALLLGCKEDEPVPATQVVVDGVLYMGQPQVSVRLWMLAPLSADQPQPLQADAVVIRAETMDYILFPQDGDPGIYRDVSGQLQLVPQAVYQLVIVKNEAFTIGVTVVPDPPEALSISQAQYAINAADRAGPGGFAVSWNNPDGRLFVGKILLLSEPVARIDPGDDENLNTEAVLDITDGVSYDVPFNQLHYYGDHAMILYAVNPEYRDFFGNTSPQLRLQQYTNLYNGLGIFTAVTPDTVFFQVIPR